MAWQHHRGQINGVVAMKIRLAVILLFVLAAFPAHAQNVTAKVVPTCGAESIPLIPGVIGIRIDQSGNLCTSGSGGGGGGLSVSYGGPIGTLGTPGGYKDSSGNFQPFSVGQQTTALSQSVVPASDSPNWPIAGNVSSGSTDSGNPLKIGCKYNFTLPTLADQQRGDAQCTNKGSLIIGIGTNANGATVSSATSDSAGIQTGLYVNNYNQLRSSGTNLWSRQTDITASQPSGIGMAAVALAPTSATAGAITPVASSAAAASQVLKASAGNLYTASAVNVTATAGFCVIINAATAPGTGTAITPLAFAVLPASGQCNIGADSGIPSSFSTGITFLVTSNASPYIFTSGVITAAISGKVQ